MSEFHWEAAYSQLFPSEGLVLLIEGTACSIIDHMRALVVSGRAFDLQGRIYHVANEAAASGPPPNKGPHQNI